MGNWEIQPNVINLAVSGAKFANHPSLSAAHSQDRTIVIAIDAFFWDSTSLTADEWLRSGQAVVNLMAQNGRHYLNGVIRANCVPANGCHIFPMDKMVTDLFSKGLTFNGRHYSKRQMTGKEGVHPNDIGNAYI